MKFIKTENYRLVNIGRVLFSMSNIGILYIFQFTYVYLYIVGFFHFFFSVLWLILIELEFVIEQKHTLPALIPSSMDISAITFFSYMTGNLHSVLPIGYIALTAVSSVNSKRLYGIFAVLVSFGESTGMGVLLYLGIIPNINIFSNVNPNISLSELIFASTWMLASLLVVNYIVFHFVKNNADLALEAKGQKAISDRLLKEYKKDMEMAKKIQRSLLPSNIESISNLDIHVNFCPMAEVGGDIYDISIIRQGLIRIFLADATGHGVHAALVTMVIKSEYEGLKSIIEKPSQLIQTLNEFFTLKYQLLKAYFSCIVIDIDLNSKKIHFASAGHPDQLLIRGDEIIFLKRTGRLIGFENHSDCKTSTIPYLPNDKILLFTDGIFEEYYVDKRKFGEEYFLHTIRTNSHLTTHLLIDLLIQKANFTKLKRLQIDDICLIGIGI